MMGFQSDFRSDFLCFIQVCSDILQIPPRNLRGSARCGRTELLVSVSLIASLSRTWREVVGSSPSVKCCLYLLGSVLVFQNGSICD